MGGHEWGWSYEAWHGDPAATLAAVAARQDAVMVVVGRHSRGLTQVVHRLTGGSVSRRLAGRCGRPVLLVPDAPGCDPAGGSHGPA